MDISKIDFKKRNKAGVKQTSSYVGMWLKIDFKLKRNVRAEIVDLFAEQCGAKKIFNNQNKTVHYLWTEENYKKLLTLKEDILNFL
jgi:hypothetical protein